MHAFRIFCEACGQPVTSWRSNTHYDNGTEVEEGRWECPCGHEGTRTIITIEVHGTML